MAHCNFSFLMELYKAWGGKNKPGQCGSILEEDASGTPMPEPEPSLPYGGEDRIEGEGSGV